MVRTEERQDCGATRAEWTEAPTTRLGGALLLWLDCGADMDVLNSSSSLLADWTSMHSGECTLHGQHFSSSHTSSVL